LNSPSCKSKSKEATASTSNLPTANNSFRLEEDKDQLKFCDENLETLSGVRKASSTSERGLRKNSDNIESPSENVNNLNNLNELNSKRKLSEDFKQKFKTEMCKFWQLNGECKFGENV
jgi:hypothetical protein